MSENFNIQVTWEYGWKHFFGKNNYANSDDTLFIGIIRDPIDWIDSFYANPHHVPEMNQCMPDFVLNTFTNTEYANQDLQESYENIFEMRRLKNDYLMNQMPKLVKNYVLLRYEDLANDTENVLMNIKTRFHLTMSNDKILKINYYKIFKDRPYVKRERTLPDGIVQLIKESVDLEQEKQLGYTF